MPSIYTAPKSIFKFDYRVYLAHAFYESLKENRNSLYLSIGRATTWPSDIEPPSPTHSLEDEIDLRKSVIGFKRIHPNDISFIIPKRIWKFGETYDKYNEANSGAKCCVVTEDTINEMKVYSVFLCVARPEDKNKPSLVMPHYNKLNPVSYIYNSDGYDWVLLYQLSEIEHRKFSTDDWIAVPTIERASDLQKNVMMNAYKRTYPYYNFSREDLNDIPINGYGADPIYQLSAYHLLVSTYLNPKSKKISNSAIFRQVGLWANPYEKVSGKAALRDTYTANEVDLSTGKILYFENRRPIQRNEAQTENVKILLGC